MRCLIYSEKVQTCGCFTNDTVKASTMLMGEVKELIFSNFDLLFCFGLEFGKLSEVSIFASKTWLITTQCSVSAVFKAHRFCGLTCWSLIHSMYDLCIVFMDYLITLHSWSVPFLGRNNQLWRFGNIFEGAEIHSSAKSHRKQFLHR